MEGDHRTLCFPDSDRTCFACCPPIRPAGYEHIHYEGMIKRVLRENTRAFRPDETGVRPITGFSCWALGYLDPGCRLVGCLLHPARHGGRDLRSRVDYGDKCRRETCPEARIFDRLDPDVKAFWLHLTDGLDTFAYSSPTRNVLFRLLNWGPELLSLIAGDDPDAVHSPPSLLRAYPLLASPLPPRASAYPVTRLALREGTMVLRDAVAAGSIERFLAGLTRELTGEAPLHVPSDSPQPVHRLPMDRTFLDFLRLSAGIQRIDPDRARALKDQLDRELHGFARGKGPHGT